jgi:rho GTPase-activating protein gacK
MNQILDFEDNELKKSSEKNDNSIANNNTEMNMNITENNNVDTVKNYSDTGMMNNNKNVVNRVSTPEYNNYRDYDMKKMSGINSGDKSNKKSKIAIKIFAFILIILAIGIGAYALITINKNNEQKAKQIAEQKQIVINVTQQDETKVDIKVEAINQIQKVAYSWNEDISTEKVIQGEGRNSIEEKGIEIPKGKNTLRVSVEDVRSTKENIVKEFTNENGKDITKPQITIEVKNGNIEITATDDTQMATLKYNWDGEEVKTTNLEKNSQNKKEIKVNITPKQGQALLKVTAIDAAGNEQKEQKDFNGVKAPEINAEQTADEKNILIYVTHDVGIQKVEYAINSKVYVKEHRDGETDNKKWTISQELNMGENTIEIKATSVEGISTQVMRGTVTRRNSQSSINPNGSNTGNGGNTNQNPNSNNGNTGNGNNTNSGNNSGNNTPNPSTGNGQTITPN